VKKCKWFENPGTVNIFLFVHYSLFTVHTMNNDNTRDIILKAAFVRFGHYGFSKTTMAEIAGDCNMSAANIYRHFDGKNDIIAELAIQILAIQEKKLGQIVNSSFRSCAEKLHALFQQTLILNHSYITEQPRMKEMVDFICQERFDLVRMQKATKRQCIETILRQGVDRGEFIIEDPQAVALAFKHATVMFHTPLFMDMHSLEELKVSCRNVVTLLLASITDGKGKSNAEN